MAANEAFASWGPSNSQLTKELGYEAGMSTAQVRGTNFRGLGFSKRDDVYITDVLKISNGATLTTGVSIDLCIVDDGTDAADLGKVVVFGAAVKLLTSGTDDLDMSTGGTEQTVNVTLDATRGQVVVGTITIATANLDSAAAGSHIAIQLRRIGSNGSDTCRGRVVLLKATAYGY